MFTFFFAMGTDVNPAEGHFDDQNLNVLPQKQMFSKEISDIEN